MTLAYLSDKGLPTGDIPNLAHLNHESLEDHLKLFLLTCRASNLPHRRIEDYAQKIGIFVAFCQRLKAVPSYLCSPVETESEEMKVSGNPLVSKLRSIPTGRNGWRDYQEVCKEIIDYCFVPPLLKPYSESKNQAGVHRRDIVYPIPGDVRGFWGHIQSAYSAAGAIVDAKNYRGELPQNEVVIVSKYFGPRKLGNFGIIISRKGPSASARKEQIDRWVHREEIIVCLGDDDLEEMVLIKERGGKPEEVLDEKIFEIRKSV